MRGEALLDALTLLDADLIESAAGQPKKKRRPVRWAAAAACVCIAAAGIFAARQRVPAPVPTAPVSVTEAGVYIPPGEISITGGTGVDMVGFFIYEGRWYESWDWIPGGAPLAGERLGAITHSIDEWTSQKDYLECSGTVTGNIYAVSGYDPAAVLGMVSDEGGLSLYVHNHNLTLKTGADVLESSLCAGRWTGAVYESHDSWWNGRREQTAVTDEAAVGALLAALNAAPFQPESDIPLPDGASSAWQDSTIGHLFLTLDDGATVSLRLIAGGYVTIDPFRSVCLQVDEALFPPILQAAAP